MMNSETKWTEGVLDRADWSILPVASLWFILSLGAIFVSEVNPSHFKFSVPSIRLFSPAQKRPALKRDEEFFSGLSSLTSLEFANVTRTPGGWPAEGIPTSRYGFRPSPFHRGQSNFHRGIDIANVAGTPIEATAEGAVRFAGWRKGYGQLVVLDHGNGYLTFYGHNAKIKVVPGETVRRGEIIALMGSSGQSTGAHVHYEVWRHGRSINPWGLMRKFPEAFAAKKKAGPLSKPSLLDSLNLKV